MRILRAVRVVVVLLLVVGMAALVPQSLRAASAPAPQEVMHEVLPGDCLHLIAGYYYGDARLWPRIWKANKQLLRNPNVVELGSVLVVPNATVPAEPYSDFTARAKGCGPAAAAGRAERQAGAARSAPRAPSKAR
jgi:hypothetical protein